MTSDKDELAKIRENLDKIVHMMRNWSSAPEARMATALERIADVLERKAEDREEAT